MKPITYRLPKQASQCPKHLAELTARTNPTNMIDAKTKHLDDP